MLSRMQDSSRFGLPWVTSLFFAGCLIVTIAGQIDPSLNRWLGGLYPEEHRWLLFTAAFAHGFESIPGLVHLALMSIIIWLVGPLTERLIGSFAFTLALILAMAAYQLLLLESPVDGNGSSGLLWLCGPILFLALRHAKRRGGPMATRDLVYERSRGMLVLMYLVIPLIMMVLPYSSGWDGHPVVAFLLGNTFHASATAVGLLAALLMRKRIAATVDLAASVSVAAAPRSLPDRLAWLIWVIVDLGLIGIIIFVELGNNR